VGRYRIHQYRNFQSTCNLVYSLFLKIEKQTRAMKKYDLHQHIALVVLQELDMMAVSKR